MRSSKSHSTPGHINIRIRPEAHNILRAVAAARGLTLLDLFDELAEPFDALLEPIRRNGRPHKLSRKIEARSDAEVISDV